MTQNLEIKWTPNNSNFIYIQVLVHFLQTMFQWTGKLFLISRKLLPVKVSNYQMKKLVARLLKFFYFQYHIKNMPLNLLTIYSSYDFQMMMYHDSIIRIGIGLTSWREHVIAITPVLLSVSITYQYLHWQNIAF